MSNEENSLRALQQEEANILRFFVDLCETYGIRYYLLGGTLLGAIRHNGFIPWDDDVDVAIPRPDYERLLKLPDEAFPEPFSLFCYQRDELCRYPWARIVSTKMREVNRMANIPRIEYAWIDLIPLDGFPNPGIGRTLHKARLSFWWNLNQIVQYDEIVDQRRERSALGKLSLVLASGFKWVSYFVDYRVCLEHINRTLMSVSYDSRTQDIINLLAAEGYREVFPREYFEKSSTYNFEGMKLNGPQNADGVCTIIYGPDYMTPPPIANRNKHHAEVITDDDSLAVGEENTCDDHSIERNYLSHEELQQAYLQLLHELDALCKKHGLRYDLCGGTMLGAVRHKGFIPWDDDIDISLPRPDYERLLALYYDGKLDLPDGREIISNRNASFPRHYARYIRKDVCRAADYSDDCFCPYIGVDIFTVDGLPDSKTELHRFSAHIQRLRRLLVLSTSRKGTSSRGRFSAVLKDLARPIINLYGSSRLAARLEKECCTYDYETSTMVGIVNGMYGEKECWSKEQMLPQKDFEFEDGTFRGYVNYDVYLSNLYGRYMELPPEEQQVPHGDKGYWAEDTANAS